jgi:plastocyanin
VPAGILVMGLGIIYGLSRVYLEHSGTPATITAMSIASLIVLVAWYFAANPKAPVWQMASVGTAVAALLVGGTVYAQVHEGPVIEHADGGEPTPGEGTPPAGETPAAGDVIELRDNVFVFNGKENPTLAAAAGADVTLKLRNTGKALHNMHIAAGGSYDSAFCKAGEEDPCSDPVRMNAGADGAITFNLPAGTYDYRCDFHTVEMAGTLEVQ